MVSPVLGKIEMPNLRRGPVAPGLALVGDAALATDPLWGVGCGWAFQSAEWLAESVAPGLLGEEPVERGLQRYRKRFRGQLAGHTALIHDYATGRSFSPVERLLFSAAARDAGLAARLEAFGTRHVAPERSMPSMLARAVAVNVRHRLRRGAWWSGDSPRMGWAHGR